MPHMHTAIGSRIDAMRGTMAACAIDWKTSATAARIVATGDGRLAM